MRTVRWSRVAAAAAGLCAVMAQPARSQSACDLNGDGAVNVVDVQLATNMALGLGECTASITGEGVCNIAVVQRVVNAALGGSCATGGGAVLHSAVVTWTASVSPDVTGYNVYRSTISGSGYTKLNTALITGATSYTDGTVRAGGTYYYVATTVAGGRESGYSKEVKAVVPAP